MAFQSVKSVIRPLKMSVYGPSGSGKTYTALVLASHFPAPSGKPKVAVIDTENYSSSLYSKHFDFDIAPLNEYHPLTYVKLIQEAAEAGYDVLIIDSLTHAWSGPGGALELVEKIAQKYQAKNKFAAWSEVSPMMNKLVETINSAPIHIIATMRAKTDYVIDYDERGRVVPHRVGLAPIQRDGLEYEFDILAMMNINNTMVIQKSRYAEFQDAVIEKPGKKFAELLWNVVLGQKQKVDLPKKNGKPEQEELERIKKEIKEVAEERWGNDAKKMLTKYFNELKIDAESPDSMRKLLDAIKTGKEVEASEENS